MADCFKKTTAWVQTRGKRQTSGFIIKGGLQHITGIRSFILHAELWKRIKILQIFVKTLFFFKFFSYSTEAPIVMGPPVQPISAKKQTKKMGKSSPKNKNDTNKSTEFLVKTFFGLVFTIIWQKNKA